MFQDALNFGRGGHGAPVRTKSGRLRSTLLGAPEIRCLLYREDQRDPMYVISMFYCRFQANESVQKSICNAIRYAVDKQEKSDYHQQLGWLHIITTVQSELSLSSVSEQQIQEKNDLKSKQKEDNFSMAKLMVNWCKIFQNI